MECLVRRNWQMRVSLVNETTHYSDVIMSAMASQITGVSIVYYLSVCSGADQRKHQSSTSLAFVRGIHRWPVNSPCKGPVTPKMFPFGDAIMEVSSFTVPCWPHHLQQERQGRWCIFDTGWSHWINYLVKEDTMKVAWPGSNEIILVSGMKIVAKSQSDLWRLIMNSSAKFKADSISGVYAKIYHRIGTSNTNSAKDVH